MKLRNIEILEKDKNKKGDLFGRLMSDLFHALGYDEPRFNIHKSGREIDLNARHRTEFAAFMEERNWVCFKTKDSFFNKRFGKKVNEK